MNVRTSKIGHDFSNKVVQKLTLRNVFNKKWSPKLIFSNDFLLYSVDFDIKDKVIFTKYSKH